MASVELFTPAPTPKRQLELLAPAKNADYGIEAIRHGADAVCWLVLMLCGPKCARLFTLREGGGSAREVYKLPVCFAFKTLYF